MSRITGLEDIQQVPQKVRLMYTAVAQMIEEGADAAGIRVSTITERAGIGKGTAYEYFDTKEEIVVCALMYQVQRLFGWLGTVLEEKETFREQLAFLLDEMGKQDGRKYCFLRYVHLLTDNSELSRMLREKMEAEEFAPYSPLNVFGKVLHRGVERGELRKDLPMDYLIFCVFSHLLTYMMAVMTADSFHTDEARMRALVYQGILNEVEGKGSSNLSDATNNLV